MIHGFISWSFAASILDILIVFYTERIEELECDGQKSLIHLNIAVAECKLK